jgi:hypothetical protein
MGQITRETRRNGYKLQAAARSHRQQMTSDGGTDERQRAATGNKHGRTKGTENRESLKNSLERHESTQDHQQRAPTSENA